MFRALDFHSLYTHLYEQLQPYIRYKPYKPYRTKGILRPKMFHFVGAADGGISATETLAKCRADVLMRPQTPLPRPSAAVKAHEKWAACQRAETTETKAKTKTI